MSAVLGHDEVDRALADRKIGWAREGDELVKVVRGPDFAAAVAFVNDVARAAEAVDHHPDIDIRWNTVTLRLSTHSAGGLTEADLSLAATIDGLVPPAP